MAKESQLERHRENFFLINGEETQVCQLMFLNTFFITEKYLSTVLNKKLSANSGIVTSDKREKHPPANTTPL